MPISQTSQYGGDCGDPCPALNCFACTVDTLQIPRTCTVTFELQTTTPSEPEATTDCGEELVYYGCPPIPADGYVYSEITCDLGEFSVIHDQALVDMINALSPASLTTTAVESGYNSITDEDCCTITYEPTNQLPDEQAATWGSSATYLNAGEHPLGDLEVPELLYCADNEVSCTGLEAFNPADTLRRGNIYVSLILTLTICRKRSNGVWRFERLLSVTANHNELWDSEDSEILFGHTYGFLFNDLNVSISDSGSLGAIDAADVLDAIAADSLTGGTFGGTKTEGHYGAPYASGYFSNPPVVYWGNCDGVWSEPSGECCPVILTSGFLIGCSSPGITCGLGPGPFDEHWYAVDDLEASMSF